MATFTVTTASDENDGGTGGSGLSLREALALANSTSGADSITFDAQLLNGQTISLTLGELVISDSLTLTGLGANNLSLSGNNLSRVLRVDNGSSSTLAVSLSGLTLTGGNSTGDGGGIFNQENLSLSDLAIAGNQSSSRGGGLFNGIGTVTLSNSSLSNNRASQDGGGLFNEGNLSASNSSLSNNTAGHSGGGIANSGTATVSGSNFNNNSAVNNNGGGLLTVEGGTSTIDQSTFSGNSAGDNGGGIYSDLSTATVSNSNLNGNRATNNGGGIYSNLSTTTVNNSNLSGNSAGRNGGGIYSDLSTTTVSNSNLHTNSAVNNGGGIFSNNSSSTTLSSSSLTQNTAGNNGGGFFNSDGSFARLNNSTLNDNSAGVNGGGLTNESSATAILSQNTFSHNTATNNGGGIFSQSSDTRLSNNTLTLNGAASGGGLFNDLGTFTATSTIVAGNTNNQDLGGSAFSSGGNNLVGNGSGASGFTNGVNGDLVGTAATPIDPLLGPLQNNGGPTLTHALLSGSPAFNAGSNPDNLSTDQRGPGFPRTLDGATDIGAIEQGIVPVPGIRLEKATNAADPNNPTPEEDADLPPGRPLPVGTDVTWTYQVFNEGNVPLAITSITDDFGTPNNPADDFTPASVLSNGFNIGDSNQNNLLDKTEVWRYTSAGVVSYQVQGSTGGDGIGGINLGKLTDYLFFFANGSAKANWQGATKGFVGDVAVNGISAAENTSGDVPYAGTIYTNDTSLGAWQKIVDQNSGQGKFSKNQASVSKGENARISSLQTDLTNAFAQINALPTTSGFTNRSSTSLDNLNTQDGIDKTYAINITSGFSVNGTQIDITGDAGDVFVLRWDTDANFKNGYQGEVKFYSGGAIVPHGGLTAGNFIHVAGDLNASGGGSNPPSPYPQGPRYNNGTGALIDGGKNFSGGGFFTGYWLTTGDPANGKTHSFSNAIFVGGWYTTTNEFSMTSGTSGVRVAPPPPSNSEVTFYTNIAEVTAQDSTGKMVMDTDASSHYGIVNHVPAPAIRIEKATNAADPNNPTPEEDADLPPGRSLPVGTDVTWTYQVFNEGNVPLAITSITDDFGTPNNPADDFTPASVLSNGFNIGDSNQNNLLDKTEVWRYTSAGVVSYQVQGSTGGGGGSITLGEAATFGILGLNGGTVSINSATKIVGDVGYSKGVTSTINQKVEDFQGTALVHSQVGSFAYTAKSYKPTGGIVSGGAADARLDTANANALATSAQIAALTPTVNLGSINDSNRSVGGTDGVATTTVVAISSLKMNSDVLELKGDAQDYFLINVAGNFDFSQSEVRLTGGIAANHILFNFPNASMVVLNKDKNIWNGTILAPTGSVEYHNPATFNGAIVAKNIDLHSSFNLIHQPFQSSAPPVTQYTNIAKVTAQAPDTGVVVTDTDASNHFGINGQSIQGTSQNNKLVGTSNNDYIVGGAGQDILTGSGGNDIFAYQAASDAGDTITDFASGDFISALPLLNSVGDTGSDPFADGYLKVYQQGNNTVISFDADGKEGAASPVTLVTLENFQGNLSYDSTRGLLGVVLPDVMPAI